MLVADARVLASSFFKAQGYPVGTRSRDGADFHR